MHGNLVVSDLQLLAAQQTQPIVVRTRLHSPEKLFEFATGLLVITWRETAEGTILGVTIPLMKNEQGNPRLAVLTHEEVN